jgi:hypothetical protein
MDINITQNEPDINGYFIASEYEFSGKKKNINILNNWNDEIKLSRGYYIY